MSTTQRAIMRDTAILLLIFFMSMSTSTTVPNVTIKAERQQSAVNTATRMSVRLLRIGPRYSAGNDFSATISEADTKSGKNTLGISAKSTHMPAVMANATTR